MRDIVGLCIQFAGLVLVITGVVKRRRATRSAWVHRGATPPEMVAWRNEARSLAWSSRRALARANRRGLAAPPELAELAVRRAEAVIVVVDERTTPSPIRTAGLVLSAGWIGYGVGALIASSLRGWWFLAFASLAVIGCILIVAERLRTPRQRRRLVQSAELNRALLGGQSSVQAVSGSH